VAFLPEPPPRSSSPPSICSGRAGGSLSAPHSRVVCITQLHKRKHGTLQEKRFDLAIGSVSLNLDRGLSPKRSFLSPGFLPCFLLVTPNHFKRKALRPWSLSGQPRPQILLRWLTGFIGTQNTHTGAHRLYVQVDSPTSWPLLPMRKAYTDSLHGIRMDRRPGALSQYRHNCPGHDLGTPHRTNYSYTPLWSLSSAPCALVHPVAHTPKGNVSGTSVGSVVAVRSGWRARVSSTYRKASYRLGMSLGT
jgi:hypothetical protein